VTHVSNARIAGGVSQQQEVRISSRRTVIVDVNCECRDDVSVWSPRPLHSSFAPRKSVSLESVAALDSHGAESFVWISTELPHRVIAKALQVAVQRLGHIGQLGNARYEIADLQLILKDS
jgi:hypothetical protein